MYEENYNNFYSSSDLIEEVTDNYSIQQLEKNIKKNYYFDAFDIISIIQGISSYTDKYNPYIFNIIKYNNEKNNISLYSFIYHNLFHNKIKLLEPHRLEVLKKIEQNDNYLINSNNEQYNSIKQDVLNKLKIPEKEKLENIKYFYNSNNLINLTSDLFRANFLLKDQTWANRLYYLLEKGLIDIFNTDIDDVFDIKDIKLFHTIKKAFDNERANPIFAINNYFDALALYILQKKLNQYIYKKLEYNLPIFFTTSTQTLNAIKNLRISYPNMFCYEQDGKRIPIIRDSLFLKMDIIFEKKNNEVDFFTNLENAKANIGELIKKEYNFRSDTLENNIKIINKSINEMIDVKFVYNILIENKEKINNNFIADFENANIWNEEQNKDYLEKIKNKISKDTTNSLENIEYLTNIITSFSNIYEDTSYIREYPDIKNTNFFIEFALIKFGVEQSNFPNLNETVYSLISQQDKDITFPLVFNIITMLNPDSIKKSKNQDEFLRGITLLWLFQKYELIIYLCKKLNLSDVKLRCEILLIYAASIIEYRKNKASIREVIDIIKRIKNECEAGSLKNEKDKLYLGLGYLYFRFWEIEIDHFPYFPELDENQWKKVFKNIKYIDYCKNGSIAYSTSAIKILRQQKSELDSELKKNKKFDKELEEKSSLLLSNYLYALNNYIFYITKCGHEKSFNNLEDEVDEFKRYREKKEWQGKFYDTLGWYSLRRIYFTNNKSLIDDYITDADDYYKKAKNRISTKREVVYYQYLKDAIMKVKAKYL